jgi:hypothetical protein
VFLRFRGTGDHRDDEKRNKTDRVHSHWDYLIGRRTTVVPIAGGAVRLQRAPGERESILPTEPIERRDEHINQQQGEHDDRRTDQQRP